MALNQFGRLLLRRGHHPQGLVPEMQPKPPHSQATPEALLASFRRWILLRSFGIFRLKSTAFSGESNSLDLREVVLNQTLQGARFEDSGTDIPRGVQDEGLIESVEY